MEAPAAPPAAEAAGGSLAQQDAACAPPASALPAAPPPSPVAAAAAGPTYDELLPLLTSQHQPLGVLGGVHRATSSTSDALIHLFDAYQRQGSASFAQTLRQDSLASLSPLLGGLRRSGGPASGSGAFLTSPMLRAAATPLSAGRSMQRLESLGSHGTGSGGALSPSVLALLHGQAGSPGRQASLDWLTQWPPRSPAGAAAPAAPAPGGSSGQHNAAAFAAAAAGLAAPQAQHQLAAPGQHVVLPLQAEPSVHAWLMPPPALPGSLVAPGGSTSGLAAPQAGQQAAPHLASMLHIGGEALFGRSSGDSGGLMLPPAPLLAPGALPQPAHVAAVPSRDAARAARRYRKERLHEARAARQAASGAGDGGSVPAPRKPASAKKVSKTPPDVLRARREARHRQEEAAQAAVAAGQMVSAAAGAAAAAAMASSLFSAGGPAPQLVLPFGLPAGVPSSLLAGHWMLGGDAAMLAAAASAAAGGAGGQPFAAAASSSSGGSSDDDSDDAMSSDEQPGAAGAGSHFVGRRDTSQSTNTITTWMQAPATHQQQLLAGGQSWPARLPQAQGGGAPTSHHALMPAAGIISQLSGQAAQPPMQQAAAAAAAAPASTDAGAPAAPGAPARRRQGRQAAVNGAAAAAAAAAADSGSGMSADEQPDDASTTDSDSDAPPRTRGKRTTTGVGKRGGGSGGNRGRGRKRGGGSSTVAAAAAAAAGGGAGGGRGGKKKRTAAAPARAPFENTRSKYRGVTRHRRSGRWESHLWIKALQRQVYLGGYEREEAAAEAYDMLSLKSKGAGAPTNFPPERYAMLLESMEGVSVEEMIMAVRRQSQGFSRGTSSYRGVTAHPSGRWESRIGVPGSRHVYLGLFADEAAAARAYDAALVRLKGATAATNFTLTAYVTELAQHHQIKMTATAGGEDILAEGTSNPGYEPFVKTGLAGLDGGLAVSAEALARAQREAGDLTAGAADAAAAAAAAAVAAAPGAAAGLADEGARRGW